MYKDGANLRGFLIINYLEAGKTVATQNTHGGNHLKYLR